MVSSISSDSRNRPGQRYTAIHKRENAFDKKNCLENINDERLPKFCNIKVKTTPEKTNFFQIYPNKQTFSKVNARSYRKAL